MDGWTNLCRENDVGADHSGKAEVGYLDSAAVPAD